MFDPEIDEREGHMELAESLESLGDLCWSYIYMLLNMTCYPLTAQHEPVSSRPATTGTQEGEVSATAAGAVGCSAMLRPFHIYIYMYYSFPGPVI